MNTKAHWENIYQSKEPTQVSWFQAHAAISLGLIRGSGIQPDEPIIDIGGGTSTLVDDLLASGYQAITVLDISAKALSLARQRLGAQANKVTWLEADITDVSLPPSAYAVWHDRAVFHFLTQPADRQRYIECARRAVRPGGFVIVATFAVDGPERCSGLDVVRYSPESMQREFGSDFELIDRAEETHHTPAGAEQKFMYCCCRRR
jgi:ubiquinone/menaquinone biosynthesis C-methylase UbiE